MTENEMKIEIKKIKDRVNSIMSFVRGTIVPIGYYLRLNEKIVNLNKKILVLKTISGILIVLSIMSIFGTLADKTVRLDISEFLLGNMLLFWIPLFFIGRSINTNIDLLNVAKLRMMKNLHNK